MDPNETIVIVSGLPRSGTSMMMQMLELGGLSVLTDKRRMPDENNPLGYYEFDKVKRLREDASWLHQAKGHCIKVIAQLLGFLPPSYDYRVIFMERNLDEVLKSQTALLEKEGNRGASLSRSRLKDIIFKQALTAKKILAERQIPALYLDYKHCVEDPSTSSARVTGFLGCPLNEEVMPEVVKPELYRQRG